MSDQTQSTITRDALSSNERKRLSKIEAAFRVHAAALHGDALSSLTVDTLCNSLAADNGVVFHFVVTGSNEEIDPDDPKSMRSFTRSVIEADEMAQRNLEFNSAARKAELEAEYLAGLKAGEALSQMRAGILEQRKAAYVAERLDARFV